MKRTPVKSSNIRSVGYHEEGKILEVEFLNNKIYRYLDVSKTKKDKLMSAKSKGSYLNRAIKNRHKVKFIGDSTDKSITTQNLIPAQQMVNHKEIAARGGRQSTPAKKYAARFRELKKKGLKEENFVRLMACMEDPVSSIFDIRTFLDKIKDTMSVETTDNKELIQLAKAYTDLHKAHHGTKVRNENINMNINIDMEAPLDPEKKEKLFMFIASRQRNK